MDILKGQTLMKSNGSSILADSALEGKDLVLYYFSGHWCPPCRQFTPMLKDFYQKVEGLEIVFVSSDKSLEEMISHMKESHGDWLALPYNPAVEKDLKQKYGVSGIPTLVVVKMDGTVVNKDAKSHVEGVSIGCLPAAQCVKDWIAGGVWVD